MKSHYATISTRQSRMAQGHEFEAAVPGVSSPQEAVLGPPSMGEGVFRSDVRHYHRRTDQRAHQLHEGLSTRTMVDFKSTPLEPLAFKARVVQFHLGRAFPIMRRPIPDYVDDGNLSAKPFDEEGISTVVGLPALLPGHTLTLRLICQSSASDQARKPTIGCYRSLTIHTRVLG
jgi:hypothetical protein